MLGQAERILELKRLSKEPSQKGNSFSITFASGKGGTGKSFTAVNTAYLLSELDQKVLLVDLDLNLANLHIMMDKLPPFSIYDYFQNSCTINDVIQSYNNNLDVIFGASGKADHPSINREKFKSFLYLLGSKNYDFIIFDSAAGEHKEIFDVISNSDLTVIVSTPEPTAVMDAYVMLKLMNSKIIDSRVEIIFNKCNSEEEGKTAFENLNKASNHFLKKDVNLLGILPFSQSVNKSIMSQVILSEKDKNSPVSSALVNISQDIVKFKQVANNKHQSNQTLSQNSL